MSIEGFCNIESSWVSAMEGLLKGFAAILSHHGRVSAMEGLLKGFAAILSHHGRVSAMEGLLKGFASWLSVAQCKMYIYNNNQVGFEQC